MTKISIQRMEGVREGDPVSVRLSVSPSHATPIEVTAAAHRAKESERVDMRSRGGGVYEGTFRPSSPGRWWVAARHADGSAEGCLWVKARNVPPAA